VKVLYKGWKVDWYYVGVYHNIRGKVAVLKCVKLQLGGRYLPTSMVTVVALCIDAGNAGTYESIFDIADSLIFAEFLCFFFFVFASDTWGLICTCAVP
jgi:hypothetical protein